MEKDSEGRENANMVIEYEKESNDFLWAVRGILIWNISKDMIEGKGERV